LNYTFIEYYWSKSNTYDPNTIDMLSNERIAIFVFDDVKLFINKL